MRKLPFLIAAIFFAGMSMGQCPVINGALVNACAADGVTEGINEFVYFTTATSSAVSAYKLSYGSRNPPASQSPTAYLYGLDATTKSGPGSVMVQPGKTIHVITSSSTIIPAGSRLVFIPHNLDQHYDLSALCIQNEIYVVYINITTPTNSKWLPDGTLANAASSLRYIQIAFNGDECTGNVRTYDGALWANPGNTPEAEGNSLAWNEEGKISYLNNGCSVIVMPVKLVSFYATKKENNALLTWKTASEVNTKEFQLEWSSDGIHFNTIGTVIAYGNSQIARDYRFIDPNTAAGKNYYRLKIIDYDGSVEYSPVASLSFAQTSNFKAYPTATSNGLYIETNALRQEAATFQLYDRVGSLLLSRKISLSTGNNKFYFSLQNLPAGAYLLKMLSLNETHVTRLIKL